MDTAKGNKKARKLLLIGRGNGQPPTTSAADVVIDESVVKRHDGEAGTPANIEDDEPVMSPSSPRIGLHVADTTTRSIDCGVAKKKRSRRGHNHNKNLRANRRARNISLLGGVANDQLPATSTADNAIVVEQLDQDTAIVAMPNLSIDSENGDDVTVDQLEQARKSSFMTTTTPPVTVTTSSPSTSPTVSELTPSPPSAHVQSPIPLIHQSPNNLSATPATQPRRHLTTPGNVLDTFENADKLSGNAESGKLVEKATDNDEIINYKLLYEAERLEKERLAKRIADLDNEMPPKVPAKHGADAPDISPVSADLASTSRLPDDQFVDHRSPQAKDIAQLPLPPDRVATRTALPTTTAVSHNLVDASLPETRPITSTRPKKNFSNKRTIKTDKLPVVKAVEKSTNDAYDLEAFLTADDGRAASPLRVLPTFFKPASVSTTSTSTNQSSALNKTPQSQLPDINSPLYKGAVNFKKHRDLLVKLLIDAFNLNVFDGLIPSNTKIAWNVRRTKTAGLCQCGLVGGVRYVKITLSEKICDRPCRVRDILAHELCHAAVWMESRDTKGGGHGPKFKSWANRVASVYPDLPLVSRFHSFKSHGEYVYRCDDCRGEVRRHSKSVDTTRKVCSRCKGRLALYRETADGSEVTIECPTPPQRENNKKK